MVRCGDASPDHTVWSGNDRSKIVARHTHWGVTPVAGSTSSFSPSLRRHNATGLLTSFLQTAFSCFPVQPGNLQDLFSLPVDTLNFFLATQQALPSSPFLTAAMIDPIPFERVKTVVEFGPGTGVMTRTLLRRMPQDSRLFVFEINTRMARKLRQALPDHRLHIINDTAEIVGNELRRLRCDHIDAVVSSLGLTMMPRNIRSTIFESIGPMLHEETVITQFQYLNAIQVSTRGFEPSDAEAFLRQFFRQVCCQFVWLNLPPAKVFVCRGPISQ